MGNGRSRSKRLNVAAVLEEHASAQRGYFTRAQAYREGLRDAEIARAVGYRQAERVGHGVYRLIGAPDDPHEMLRVAWLRLTPDADTFERTHRPRVWVAGRSAAQLHGLGDIPADTPEFISVRRVQPRFEVVISVRSKGVPHEQWIVVDGMPVIGPVRLVVDLVTASIDGGHVGKVAAQAIARGMTTASELQRALGNRASIDALIDMAGTR